MKKTFIWPFMVLLFMGVSFISSGIETRTFSVEKYDFTVQLPSDWEYIAFDMLPSDPVFDRLEMDGEGFLNMMEQRRLLAVAVSDDMELVLVNPSSSETMHLADVSNEELEDFVELIKQQDMNEIIDNAKSEIDTNLPFGKPYYIWTSILYDC